MSIPNLAALLKAESAFFNDARKFHTVALKLITMWAPAIWRDLSKVSGEISLWDAATRITPVLLTFI
jgi:hypothetical protein